MIQFDSATAEQTTTATSISYQHIYGGFPSGVVIVVVAFVNTSTVSSVTYAGQTMTLIRNDLNDTENLASYILINPPAGTNTVVVTFNLSVQSYSCAASYYNVFQSTTLDSTNIASGLATSSLISNYAPTKNKCLFVTPCYASGGSIVVSGGILRTTSANILGIIDSNIPVSSGVAKNQGATFTSSALAILQLLNIAPIFTTVGSYPPYIQVGNKMSRNERAT